MAAFEKVKSGFPSVDEALDYIRLGDNVVLQVSSIEEFRFFVEPYVRQAKEDKRRLVYFRFAGHEPLVAEDDAVWYCLDPAEGFEQFAIKVHRLIEQEGYDVFYVFDCLSELQGAWAADLMMGNFFCVTCPFLFKLDTVAFFPVIRGRHSYETIARIQETTQLFLDIYSDEENMYLHPVKVWNRYSATMFLPHRAKRSDGVFKTLTDAVGMSRYYAVVGQYLSSEDQNLDSWERYFQKCQRESASMDTEEIHAELCRMMMTKDAHVARLFEKFYSLEDYLKVKRRMIGSGRIGGKSCGMLLSRSIVENCLPDVRWRLEPHDSFFIGDHVFYTYLVFNGLWDLHIAQKDGKGYYELGEKLSEGILSGEFPDNIRVELRRMLEYFGQAPIIVRSSSILEDGFGNAFAGKYESVFCANQGSDEERLEKLEAAIRTVYASTVDASALEYRAARGLDTVEEQMAILVQRVSGSLHGDYLFPSAAGVGYSYDTYGWSKNMDPQKGMLRMVLGLGTRAVDRTDRDYPRIIHIDQPEHSYLTTMDERVRFSQRVVDVIDLKKNALVEIPLDDVVNVTPVWYHTLVMEHDYEVERRLYDRGIQREVCFGTCRGYVQDKQFLSDMEQILSVLQREYTYPVDIEFTVNSNKNKEYVICLLQCRPLQTFSAQSHVEIPEVPREHTLFHTHDASMGLPQDKVIDEIVFVDAAAYYAYPYARKATVAALLTDINLSYRDSGKHVLLMVPGRIGTSSPELGIPVKFSGISNFCAIVETDEEDSLYAPELSFGSHMFQDLVEAEIFYTALFHVTKEDEQKRTAFFETCGTQRALPEQFEELSHMVKIYSFEEKNLKLYYDIKSGETLCALAPDQSVFSS
ncbi:MAG: PEP/pyruvate-binding domain-containing protein [Lachnospiraceae bacterium]|nr:PEP/pyruvate-binding domain-containing protein [Lachnospiraceae bacterium]